MVTISRQLGSLGYEIGEKIANQLGYRLVSRELINQAALRGGVPEVALAVIDDLGLLGINPTPEQFKEYQNGVEQVLCELAELGKVVIVGRAGQVILQGYPFAFHVRVMAPVEKRIERVSVRSQVSLDAARAQIETSDRKRKAYLQRAYQVNWDNVELYDLVINTACLDAAQAADLIEYALRTLSKKCAPTA